MVPSACSFGCGPTPRERRSESPTLQSWPGPQTGPGARRRVLRPLARHPPLRHRLSLPSGSRERAADCNGACVPRSGSGGRVTWPDSSLSLGIAKRKIAEGGQIKERVSDGAGVRHFRYNPRLRAPRRPSGVAHELCRRVSLVWWAARDDHRCKCRSGPGPP